MSATTVRSPLRSRGGRSHGVYEVFGLMDFIGFKQEAEVFVKILKEKGFEIVENGAQPKPATPWRGTGGAPDDRMLLYFAPMISSGGDVDLHEMYQVGRISDYPNRRPKLCMPIPPLPEKGAEQDWKPDFPVLPQGIVHWSIGDDSATYQLADGSRVSVPIAIYRIWESGFIAAAKALGGEEEAA